MLTKLFLAFSLSLFGAGGMAAQSALGIQYEAASLPLYEAAAQAELTIVQYPLHSLSAAQP